MRTEITVHRLEAVRAQLLKDSVSGETHILVHRAGFSPCPPAVKGVRKGLCYEGSNFMTCSPPKDPNSPTPNIIILGVRISAYELVVGEGSDANIHTIMIPKIIYMYLKQESLS